MAIDVSDGYGHNKIDQRGGCSQYANRHPALVQEDDAVVSLGQNRVHVAKTSIRRGLLRSEAFVGLTSPWMA